MAVLNVLERHNYANIFERMDPTDRVEGQAFSERYGFKFTTISRTLLINDMLAILRPDAKNMGSAQWNGRIKVLCTDIIAEEETFVYDVKGRADHLPGAFSDMIMALGLAIRGHLDTPLDLGGYRISALAVRSSAYEGGLATCDHLKRKQVVGGIRRR